MSWRSKTDQLISGQLHGEFQLAFEVSVEIRNNSKHAIAYIFDTGLTAYDSFMTLELWSRYLSHDQPISHHNKLPLN